MGDLRYISWVLGTEVKVAGGILLFLLPMRRPFSSSRGAVGLALMLGGKFHFMST